MDSYHKLIKLEKDVRLNTKLDLLTEINKMAEIEFISAKKTNENFNIEDFFIEVYKVFGDDVLIEASVVGCCNSFIHVDFNRVFERIKKSKESKGIPPSQSRFLLTGYRVGGRLICGSQ